LIQRSIEMPHKKFWLYDWIDTLEVKELNHAESLLKDAGLRKDLRKRATEIPFTTEEIQPSDNPTIVAGQAIDLSGQLDCLHWDCLKKQIDNLFSHVWHYFDRIVVVGPSAHEYSRLLSPDVEPQVIERLLNHIRLLLYIREIGAEDLLIFRQKRPPCEMHFEDHLKEVGLDPELMLADDLVAQLASKSEIVAEPHEDHFDYSFTHPEFEHTVWGAVDKSSARSDVELRHAVTTSVMKKYLSSLASDIRTAQVLDSPLGSTVSFHGQLLKTIKAGLKEADVAFHLRLPVLENISPAILLKIRYDEKLHFEKFRQSLRLAIRQRLDNVSSEKATEVAEEIRKDVINPALNDIELRLKAAKSAVTKKASLSVALGAFATTCGFLTANPFLIAAGATPAVGYTIAAGQKFIEEKRDIALSDMYFLWQAQGHSKAHM
jgi:hypothetical protein